MASRIVTWGVAGLRLAFAALAAFTLAFACNRAATPPTGFGTLKFFSYFTILSNSSATVVLAIGGVALLLGRRGVPDGVRGAVTCYMVITGIIYLVVLQADQAGELAPWIDDVVHRIMPVVVLVDWLVVPPRDEQQYSILRYWLLFPIAYVTYSLIRGHFVHWYPYPFLDPHEHGYAHVALECALIALTIVAICLAVVWVGRQADRRSWWRSARRASGS